MSGSQHVHMAQTLNVVFSSAGQLAMVGVFQWLTWWKADVERTDPEQSQRRRHRPAPCNIQEHNAKGVVSNAAGNLEQSVFGINGGENFVWRRRCVDHNMCTWRKL